MKPPATLATVSRTVSLCARPELSRLEGHVFAMEPTSGTQARNKGSLYIVTETNGETPNERSVCRLIADALREEYYRDASTTVEESLGKAIERANFKVYNDERFAEVTDRPVVAVTCIAVRDHEALIGQTLPVQSYVANADGFSLIPDPAFWEGDIKKLDATHYFGQAPKVAYDLYRTTLDDGEMLTVCSSSLAQSLDDRALEGWLRSTRPNEVTQRLRAAYTRVADEPAYAIVVQNRPDIRTHTASGNDVKVAGGRPTGTKTSGTLSGGRTGSSRASASLLTPAAQRLLLYAVGVVVVIAVLWIVATRIISGVQSSRQQGAESSAVTAVNSIMGGVAQARDPSAVATAVQSANSVLSSASSQMSPQGAATVQALILQKGDPLMHAARLSQVKLVLDRSSDAGTTFTQIAVSGSSIYLLDSGNRQVIDVSLGDNKATAVLTTGRVVGNDTVDTPVAICGFPQGLLVVDNKNNVWQLDNATSTVRKVTVPGSDSWGAIRAIATYGDALYVLDIRQNKLWKYPIEAQGLGQPVNYFVVQAPAPPVTPVAQGTATPTPAPTATPVPAPDVTHASDMAINGPLYIVMAGGSVLKFQDGLSQPFPSNNLPGTLPSPSQILAPAGSTAVYIVDPAASRILQMSASGDFQRQILLPPDAPKSLLSIQAASIDESRHLVYLISGKTLSYATLPN